ncbi:MAG: hypothetical protein Phog2KO_51150 [Phototrophicaceae bacterium]
MPYHDRRNRHCFDLNSNENETVEQYHLKDKYLVHVYSKKLFVAFLIKDLFIY